MERESAQGGRDANETSRVAAVCNAIVRCRARKRLSAWQTFCSWKSERRWLAACTLECDPVRCRWVAHATASSNAAEIGSEQSTPRVAAPPPAAQQGPHDRAASLRSNVALTAAWMPGSSEDDGGEDVWVGDAAMQLR
jgi:hypothetical protein